jgi:hypothetical protein
MDPSRNCNKGIGRTAFIPFGDGGVLPLESGVSFVESEFVRGYAGFGSAEDRTVESGAVPPSNHVVPPNAWPLGSGPENQLEKNGSKKKPSLEQFQLSAKLKLSSNHP